MKWWRGDQYPKVKKERKPTLRGKWENAINGKQTDNVRKEIQVVSVTNPHLETDAREDEKNNRSLQP